MLKRANFGHWSQSSLNAFYKKIIIIIIII